MKGLVAADWGCAVFNDRRRVPHARENKRRAAELIGCVNGAAERVDQEATMLGFKSASSLETLQFPFPFRAVRLLMFLGLL